MIWSYIANHHHISEDLHRWIGFPILIAMILGMNKWARTDIILRIHREWWIDHPVARWAHAVSNAGELAGILIGGIFIASWNTFSGHPIEAEMIAFGMAFTLFGIMSFASLIQDQITPVLQRIEHYGNKIGNGRFFAIWFGSMSASLVGEPAAAQILGNYFVDRVSEESRPKMSGALAATIGAGGALLWFAAPPILIVQARLEAIGWTLVTLITFVGLPAMVQVMTVSWQARNYAEPLEKNAKMDPLNWGPLLAFGALVAAHIAVPLISWIPMEAMAIVYFFDIAVGLLAIAIKWQELEEERLGGGGHFDFHSFEHIFQPGILAVLLIVLELVGHISEPSVEMMSHEMVSLGLVALGLTIGLFIMTAVTSAFADNALASTVIVAIPIAMLTGPEQTVGIAAVLMGALYGGVLLPPSNLPNFTLQSIFKVKDSKEWLSGSVPVLPTGIIYILILTGMWFSYVQPLG